MAAVLLASWLLTGCASDAPPPPELTPAEAAARISQRWAHGELNHFRVALHSDTLIECGVNNGLWKLSEVTDDKGYAWSTIYRLTDKGREAVTAISLKESGRGHEILLKGPYRVEINSGQPNTKNVAFRWDIDWDKAPEGLKACVPRFELSGTETAIFELNGQEWRFASYLNPEEAPAPQQDNTPPPDNTPVFDKFR
jgi:hypothetical protein